MLIINEKMAAEITTIWHTRGVVFEIFAAIKVVINVIIAVIVNVLFRIVRSVRR